jgi:S-DNA-T family DNA segregation ATPase FtsK/SpoIIIE
VGDWDWLKWLPHVGSDHSPVAAHHLASTPAAAVRLVAAIEEVLEDRGTDRSGQAPIPSVVLVVENGAPVERSRLVELSELGSRAGVYVLWLAPTKSHLPAACKTFIELNPAHPGIARVSWVNQEHCVAEVAVESLEAVRASGLARTLSPVVDAGARVDDDSDLPRAVSLVSLLGLDALSSPDFILDRWRLSNSLPAVGGCTPGSRRRRENHLRALVGAAAGQGFVLDLRTHGPHALVGGTTGAGKSEFLQAWVMGLAAEHSPARVTFLFVDYKGGAAFGDCVRLPHAVGLVTDLSPHLVARALTSLNAELRYREEILRSAKAKDLLELERRGEGEIPPSLVIVVDEFAALAQEVPEFVDGVVNVAQRGRSLGLHLILATQQPAGVIKGNLRANTNLRVALRMADPDDSVDVVGTPQAAAFDPGIPGRALAKMGPTRLTPFQSGYVGGWTSAQPPKPIVTVEDFGFGQGATWEEQEEALVGAERPQGPNDLHRMVSTIRGAFDSSGMAAPRRPWLDTLANVYDLARSPQSRTDSELIFGVLDAPERIQQDPVAFLPDHDGNMVVYGTGGSGKSTFLRTLGIVAGLSTRGGPCHVYGLDFGTRGLQMLETLPHVGGIINGDDQERVTRLLGMLRRTVDDRAVRYAAVSAGSIGQYRSMAKMPQEPRILVLLDGIGPFRQTYEAGPLSRWFDMFQGIAADGRQVGVHMVVSADRQAAVPAALASVIQRRLVLRLAGDVECSMLGVPPDAFAVDSPPGRGFLDGHEVQVAVLGGTATTPRQADAIAALGSELRRLDRPPPAPVGRLTDRVRLVELPVEVGGLPALGIADDTLAPMGFAPEGSLLVIGPPQSGKTTVVATIALSLRRYRPSSTFAYLGSVQSPLSAASYWFDMACGPDDVAGLAKDLAGRLTSASERASGLVVVIEGIAEFLNTPADGPLQELLKACRASGSFVIANGETSTMSSSWPLLQPLKAPRHGIALQPDQIDGDSVFRTSFPRASRVEFPPGRGWYIRGGKVRRIQCALPEDDEPGTP